MTALRVTILVEEKGSDVEGAEEVGGATVCVFGHRGLSCALLRRMVAASMVPITEK